MTTNEFREWATVTEPRMKWTMDQFRWHNNNEMLFYFGGEKGKFVCLYSDGRMQAGTYEGAIPHIAGACFQASFEKTFDNQQEAFARVVEIGGGQFLRSWRRVAFEVEKTLKLYTKLVRAQEAADYLVAGRRPGPQSRGGHPRREVGRVRPRARAAG